MSMDEKLSALGISRPPVAPPVAAFVPFVRSANLVFLGVAQVPFGSCVEIELVAEVA